jgi:hypothetical protein
MFGFRLALTTNVIMLALIAAHFGEMAEGHLPDEPDTVTVTLPTSGANSIEMVHTVTGDTMVIPIPDKFRMVRLVGPLSGSDPPYD